MNGFIRGAAHGVVLLAATVAFSGCKTLGTCCDDGAACGGDGVCRATGEHDWEQLHPDHCWPEQFNRISRRRVYKTFGTQVTRGDALELTIWRHYFLTDSDRDHLLNGAGEARIRYLARRKPFVIRDLYLATSFDTELDRQREQTVIDYAKQVSFVGAAPDAEPLEWTVSMVDLDPPGMFGPEAASTIERMTGPPLIGVPRYEPQIKRNFLSGSSGP